MKGCSLNLATQKPLTRPMSAPSAMTARITTGMGRGPIASMKRLAVPAFCSMMADKKPVRPMMRPAERSVPVKIIQPAMPSAMGRREAVKDRMLMMLAGCKKAGRCDWM